MIIADDLPVIADNSHRNARSEPVSLTHYLPGDILAGICI